MALIYFYILYFLIGTILRSRLVLAKIDDPSSQEWLFIENGYGVKNCHECFPIRTALNYNNHIVSHHQPLKYSYKNERVRDIGSVKCSNSRCKKESVVN